MKSKHLVLSCLALIFCWCLFTFAAYGETIAADPPGQEAMAKQYSKLMPPEINSSALRHPALTKWLHMLDQNELAEIKNSSVMAFAPQVPGDLARILNSIGEGKRPRILPCPVPHNSLNRCWSSYCFWCKTHHQKKNFPARTDDPSQ